MEDFTQEQYFEKSPTPLTIENMEKILFQMKNSICRIINNDGKKGTGFFCRISYNKKLKAFLITNNHILNEKEISNGKKVELTINDGKNPISFEIDDSRIKFTNKDLDVTFIEIKQNKDKINDNNILDIDEEINSNLENLYKNKPIYILHYPKGNKVNVSYGLSNRMEGYDFFHWCNTEEGSSGSPIISLESLKVIAIHRGAHNSMNLKINLGTFIKNAIESFNKEINKNNNILNREYINNINNKDNSQVNKEEKNSINKKDKFDKINDNIKSKDKNIPNVMINSSNNIIKLNEITGLRRLAMEYKLCMYDSDLMQNGITINLTNNNLFNWKVAMVGPFGSPYQDGLFFINIFFPNDYPNHGPEFKFINRVYHPCIKDGQITLNRLGAWRCCGKVPDIPTYNVKHALFDILCLLSSPEIGLRCDYKMYKQYEYDNDKFNETAREWTKKYAS